MKVLGIDPGYERLGIAVIQGKRGEEKLLHSECFKTSAKLPFAERLVLIGEKVEKIINKYKPDLLSIENLFLNKNQKTVMRVAEVRGAIIYIAKKNKARVVEYTPLQIKNAIIGYGRADKRQVEFMISKLIKIPARKMIDDEYDAIAVALTASASFRQLSTG
ncbi:MAG: crossover junction endodeoxyribonuclease RuvC [Patescibacteria group bacterium]